MKIKNSLKVLTLFIAIVSSLSCSKKSDVRPQLDVSVASVSFPSEGGKSEITLACSDKWTIDNPASSWLALNQTSGNSGSTTVQITSSSNTVTAPRSTILLFSSPNGLSQQVEVSQAAMIFPSYNTSPKAADSSGMLSTAVQLAAKIKLGWNIGNTMEAPGGESGWGNPSITESYVKFVKQLGFTAIRIPCAYYLGHTDNPATAHIDPNWLNRVKEVVGYCVNNDMYVLLNIHWDGGWLENNCTPEKKDSVNARQKAYWEQIATTLRDYDEHLMFASANEPNVDNTTKMGVLNSYNQTFVNAVRATGGRNRFRTLVVQGPSDFVNSFPVDPTPNRLMYEEHNYTPFQFTALSADADWGKMFYYWGAGHHSTIEPERNATWGEESEQMSYFQKIKEKFVNRGIPVLLGEYGAYRRTTPKDSVTHNNSVDYWITFTTKQAITNGIKPFFWDTGGALDRRNNTVLDQRTIDAIIAGSK